MAGKEKRKPPKNGPDADFGYAALSSGVTRYLESVEQFFPYAVTQLSLKQHVQHAAEREKYPSEELEMERAQLRDQLQGIIPRAIRGSALVVLYSVFESTVIDFSKSLATELQCSPFDPVLGRGSFQHKADRYFAVAFKVKLFSDRLEMDGINILRILRNSFIHEHSAFSRLPSRVQASIRASKSRLPHCQIHDGIWVPSADYIKVYGGLIHNWARLLSQRAIERVGTDKYL